MDRIRRLYQKHLPQFRDYDNNLKYSTTTYNVDDTAATVTMGASATTATVLFGTAYGSVPHCVVTSQPTGQASPISYVPVTTSIAITQNSTSGNKIDYVCVSNS